METEKEVVSTKDEKSLSLYLTIAEVNTVLTSLSKLPYEIVGDLIPKIRNQVIPQLPKE